MSSSSIAILTGPGPRHAYFIRKLTEHFRVGLILIESLDYPTPPPKTHLEEKAWNWFFKRRDLYEQEVFGAPVFDPDLPIQGNVQACSGSINNSENLDRLKALQPSAIAVFGTGIIGSDMLSHFGDRMFNFHPGLTWTHRGSSCNFWPILENRLNCMGATIIKINQGIDTGEIYNWGAIGIEPNDNEQSLIGKTILLGTQLMIDVLKNGIQKKINTRIRKEKGRLYLMKHFTPSATLKLKNRVESGELKQQIQKAL